MFLLHIPYTSFLNFPGIRFLALILADHQKVVVALENFGSAPFRTDPSDTEEQIPVCSGGKLIDHHS